MRKLALAFREASPTTLALYILALSLVVFGALFGYKAISGLDIDKGGLYAIAAASATGSLFLGIINISK